MKNGLPFSLLLVDDDEDDRIFMDDAFLRLGYDAEVKKFKDAPGFFHYLESIDDSLLPSLFVLDNRIAEVEAQSIIQKLQAEGRFRHIPIVVCSSMLSPSQKEKLLAIGVFACFEKGNNLEETLQLARQLKQIAESSQVGQRD